MDFKANAESSATSSTSSEDGWQDIESEGESVSVLSFFDDATFSDAHLMVDYCRDKFGFDFLEPLRRLNLDFHEAVKLCNFGMALYPLSFAQVITKDTGMLVCHGL